MRDEALLPNIAAQLIHHASELQRAHIFQGSTERPFEVQKITLDLSTARREDNPYKIGFPFRSIYVGDATDSSTEVLCKVNSKDSYQSAFPLKKNDAPVFPHPISEAYLHWEAQSGKTMDLYVFVTGEFRSGSLISVNSGGVSISEGDSVSSQAAVSVTTSATQIVASDADRKVAVIQNHGSVDVYLGASDVVASSTAGQKCGIKLEPGQSVYWKNTGALYGIVASGSAVVAILKES